MSIRTPAVAEQFYPGSVSQCRSEVEHYLSASADSTVLDELADARLIGGIVPHAGWVCSGAVAAEVIKPLLTDGNIETCIIFGAMHRLSGPEAVAFTTGAWQTPMGEIEIDEPLGSAVLESSSLIVEDSNVHRLEHSIEVQVPFIQHLSPETKLLPIIVPPSPSAEEVGRLVAECIQAFGRRVVYIGSSDLTHYGPRYQFTPQGVGDEALKWAKQINDKRIIDLMLNMSADRIVDEAGHNHNACGSGAVAATIAACRAAGADKAKLIRHTTSAEVLQKLYGKMEDSVGYASVIFYKNV